MITSWYKNTNSARNANAVSDKYLLVTPTINYAAGFVAAAFAALPVVFFAVRPAAFPVGLADGPLAAPVAAVVFAVEPADGPPAAPVAVAVFVVGQLAGGQLVAPAVVAFVVARLAGGRPVDLAVFVVAPAGVVVFAVRQLAGGRLAAPVVFVVAPAGVAAFAVLKLVAFVAAPGPWLAVVVPLFLPGRYYFVQAVLQQGLVYAGALRAG